MEHIRNEARCPVVSLRQAMNGINNILLDERDTMEEIIRHVIEVHKAKDIAFMSGPKDRYDANFRLACFKRIMKEYGYEIGENRVFYGNFWKDQGGRACDYFFSAGKWPEAIICANDNMALSVCDILCERGIRVPEDIIVTGYDGEEEGKYYQPALTTVKVDFRDMAHQAVNLIDKHQEDLQNEIIYAKTKCYLKESCGCKKTDTNFAKRAMHYSSNLRLSNMEMQFSFMSIDFGEIGKYVICRQSSESIFTTMKTLPTIISVCAMNSDKDKRNMYPIIRIRCTCVSDFTTERSCQLREKIWIWYFHKRNCCHMN